MKALWKPHDDVLVVSISGCLNYEALDAFRIHYKRFVAGKRVVVNLGGFELCGELWNH